LALLLLCGETRALGGADKILDLRVCGVCLLFLFVILCVWFCGLLRIKDAYFDERDNEDGYTASAQGFDLCFCLSSERAMNAIRQMMT
jgi:hypothetical protein